MRFVPFAHLHVHSDYSLLSGALSVSALLDRVAELRQPAVALTDHGNLFGAVEFYSAAIRRGIKPILGCEMFLCEDHKKRKSAGPRGPQYAQILLLARNNHGWRNLMRLVSISYLEGFYYKPRIDKALLREYGEGLIALSSGWNGEIERHLRRGDVEAAASAAREYADIFPDHCFFLELQRHGVQGQEALNHSVLELAHATGLPVVATNNVHFLSRADFHAFEAMLALRDGRTLADDASGHYTPENYIKSYEEMSELFEDVPEAVENSLHIASRCNVDLQFGDYQLPDFIPPQGMDLRHYIRKLAREGLEARWMRIRAGNPEAGRKDYEARLDFELGVIEQMGFPGYFLIVADFIRWARKHEIPVGPGRGSGAGSLVAYSLGITDLDPIRYGLLFERFLNPERVSMPDFDIDFCMSRRDEVIRYVTEKYGAGHVAQIITFGSMKAKAVVRDVGRVLGMELAKVNAIAKLVPNDLHITLDKAVAAESRLKAMLEEDAEVARLFTIARRLEGLHRHAGRHAAGVVIGRAPLIETVPLYKESREEGVVVQWDMKCVEKVGLVKFDFLGLKTLTVLHLASTFVRRQAACEEERNFDLSLIPLDDADTYALLQQGRTSAVFQLESTGMRELMLRLRPDCFEDIIALVALFRPGPLQSGMVDTFIDCKQGRRKVEYPVPQLEPILAETYGVILYQEQVMKIAQVLAGYTLGQADLLRRAMGKKKPEEMAEQRQIFMEGARRNGIPEKQAEHIFDLMEKFAGYGFNKSHSAAYALIAYQTAYLKAHYPQAFMAATLSCDMGNSDKIAMLVADCKEMGITILPPHVNRSDWEFLPEGEEGIRFGLGAVKGIGEAAVRELVRCRNDGGEFSSIEDLCVRMPPRVLNRRILEALIKAGALEGLIPHPRAALEGLAGIMDIAERRRRDLNSRQSALFEGADAEMFAPAYPDVRPWGTGECLAQEKEVLGFYLTGHPLEEYDGLVRGLTTSDLKGVKKLPDGARAVVAVGVSGVRIHRGARGTMAFVQVEDLCTGAEMVCFADVYRQVAGHLEGEQALLAAVRVDRSRDSLALIAEAVEPLPAVLPDQVEQVCIRTSALAWDEKTVDAFASLIDRNPGPSRVRFLLDMPSGACAVLASAAALRWNEEVAERLHAWFGAGAVHLQCRPWQPQGTGDQGRKREPRRQYAA